MDEKDDPHDILLIDEDRATKILITQYFESKGYSCKCVSTGAKGIDELKRHVPKVILLDVLLPDAEGYEICTTIKTLEDFKEIPLFYVTALQGEEVEQYLAPTGADGYILKPFEFSDFEPILDILRKTD